jgi:hypothetical protein
MPTNAEFAAASVMQLGRPTDLEGKNGMTGSPGRRSSGTRAAACGIVVGKRRRLVKSTAAMA